MKKVLVFSTIYVPLLGGAEIAIKEITDRLGDIRFDMITLRFDRNLPKKERIGNINVYRVGFSKKNPTSQEMVTFPLKINKILFPFSAWRLANKLHKKEKYDCVWGMMAAFAGFAALFFKLTHRKAKYLLTLQEGIPIDDIKRKARFVFPLFKMIFTKADEVQAISNYLAGFARDMGYKRKVHVVPNAVDIDRFGREFPEEEIRELRAGLGVKDFDILLVHTGRLVKKNGLEDIIEALRHLPKNIKFLSIGLGPDSGKLKNLAKDFKVADRVIFHDFVGHEKLVKFLKASDIFVRASLSEGLGISFLEAMATGIPVIATPVGGITDFLSDPWKNPDKPPTGLFANVNHPETIAAKVKVYLYDIALREKIIHNARELVKSEYNWDVISSAMKDLFIQETIK